MLSMKAQEKEYNICSTEHICWSKLGPTSLYINEMMNGVVAGKMSGLIRIWPVRNRTSLIWQVTSSPHICDAEPDAVAAIRSSHSCGPWLVAGELEADPHWRG